MNSNDPVTNHSRHAGELFNVIIQPGSNRTISTHSPMLSIETVTTETAIHPLEDDTPSADINSADIISNSPINDDTIRFMYSSQYSTINDNNTAASTDNKILQLPPSVPVIPVVQPNSEGETTVLNGAGASFPAEVYNSWLASYSYSRRSADYSLAASYSAYNSGVGKAAAAYSDVYGVLQQYGATDANMTSLERMLSPGIETIPMVAG